MKIEFGIKGSKNINCVKDIDININHLKESKNLENFTRDNFESISYEMVNEIVDKIGSEVIPENSISYFKFNKVLSQATVKNCDELLYNYRTDLELGRDIINGKMKGFGGKK